MSKEKLCHLLQMICHPLKRQMLIEFKILIFCFSNQVQRIVNDKEKQFYKVLSSIEVDENLYAEASFLNFKLIINVFEIDDENQAEATCILHIVTLDEELEQKLQNEDIKAFLEQSGVEID
jgi:uncharacterized protein YyaL (SSP411 family)